MKFRILPACGLIHASSTLQSEVCVPCQYAQRRTKHRPEPSLYSCTKNEAFKAEGQSQSMCVCCAKRNLAPSAALHVIRRFIDCINPSGGARADFL